MFSGAFSSQLARKPWFSYLTIFLLQLKVVWDMWRLRDLTSGDTSYYFVTAFEWYRSLRTALSHSPMYTAFYGAFLHLSPDAYFATIAHRLTIVLILALLVLALMRQLLPAGIAWLMAAWWVVLPVNFEAMYEVHLFAFVPMVAALLVIAVKPGPWGRGWGVAILFASTVLMRNELLVATGCFAALALGWEAIARRRGAVASTGSYKAFGIPLLASVPLILFFLTHSIYSLHTTLNMLDAKHRQNMCQVYAFSYQQRQPEWNGSPWAETLSGGCQQLMMETFGKPEPSFTEALKANPRAWLEHLYWNATLIPNGLQVQLLNATSGRVTPDFAPVTTNSTLALVLSVLLLVILIPGGFLLYRERGQWRQEGPAWAWIGMLCLALMVIIVVVVERPRPEYAFSLGLLIRAAVGACMASIGNWFSLRNSLRKPAAVRQAKRIASARGAAKASKPQASASPKGAATSRFGFVFPVVVVLAILLAPMYYRRRSAGRPLLGSYRRLEPFQELFERPHARFVSLGWPDELCNYLGRSNSCRGLAFAPLRDEVLKGNSWNTVLGRNDVGLLFADEGVLADPVGRDFVYNAEQYGWKAIAQVSTETQRWSLLAPKTKIDILPTDGSVQLGKGWHDYEEVGGKPFRWVDNDAEFHVRRRRAGPVVLAIALEPGPSLDGKPLALQVFAANKVIWTLSSTGPETAKIPLPANDVDVRLHVTGSPRKTIRDDPRILNFRVLDITVQ